MNDRTWDFKSTVDIRKSLNNLFETNKGSLKIVKLQSTDQEASEKCVPLSLNICQNLEEFRGISLTERDIQLLSQVSTLKKLELSEISASDLELFNSVMPKLRYLSIDCYVCPSLKLFNYLSASAQYFPNLERLQITYEEEQPKTEFNLENAIDALVKNFRKIKSIQIDEVSVGGINITSKYLYELFKSTGVLVIFGEVKDNHLSITQENFENFLEDDRPTFGNYMIKRDYMIKKREFVEWCKNNPGYGY